MPAVSAAACYRSVNTSMSSWNDHNDSDVRGGTAVEPWQDPLQDSRIREFFDSEDQDGRVSVWMPKVSLSAERKTNIVKGVTAWDITLKVRSDDPQEAVLLMDTLRAKMEERYP